jgi:hypothetical protein
MYVHISPLINGSGRGKIAGVEPVPCRIIQYISIHSVDVSIILQHNSTLHKPDLGNRIG